MKSINPYTNELIEEFVEYSDSRIGDILTQSEQTFQSWKRTGFEYRKSLVKEVSRLLLEKKTLYAEAITAEMGKPLRESKAEVEKCAWVCEYYAENAESFLKSETISTDADESFVSFEPLGPILGIMPWNFPFWQVFRFAIPTLMAGNTVLLKHASNVQLSARNIENVFSEAGFPLSVFTNIVVGSARTGKIIENDKVKAISLTGSEYAGQEVAGTAGRNIKKSLLELGGSNAFVILEDADIEKAVEIGINARMQNAGQSCIAAKRFIVHEKVSETFIELFRKSMNNLVSGDPMETGTNIGPLSSIKQAETVEEQLLKSVSMGARIICGGHRNGSFFEPTLVVDVRPGMPLFDEEIFGPVAPVIIANNDSEAVRLANATKYGLGVSLFTNDLIKAKKLVCEFEDGAVFINALVKSDPRLPFGGTKMSGYGRELSLQGIREFVNTKTVYIKRFS